MGFLLTVTWQCFLCFYGQKILNQQSHRRCGLVYECQWEIIRISYLLIWISINILLLFKIQISTFNRFSELVTLLKDQKQISGFGHFGLVYERQLSLSCTY